VVVLVELVVLRQTHHQARFKVVLVKVVVQTQQIKLLPVVKMQLLILVQVAVVLLVVLSVLLEHIIQALVDQEL
jgi:hypothetical protein